MLRVCNTCGIEKPIDEFHKRSSFKETRHWHCKLCAKAKLRKWAHDNREHKVKYAKDYYKKTRGITARQKEWGPRWAGTRSWIQALKSNPCIDCKISYHFSVMDLDHVRGEKLFNVGAVMGTAISDEAILEEIQKCDLVCANCHRLRTWRNNHE